MKMATSPWHCPPSGKSRELLLERWLNEAQPQRGKRLAGGWHASALPRRLPFSFLKYFQTRENEETLLRLPALKGEKFPERCLLQALLTPMRCLQILATFLLTNATQL
jgi:hypothetical protein